MILKLRTASEGWVYYNISRKIQIAPLTKEQFEYGTKNNEADRYEIIEELTRGKPHSIYDAQLTEIKLEDSDKPNGELIIYTNQVAYLLNDEGKTVEKLN